jgi:hypothetical protein
MRIKSLWFAGVDYLDAVRDEHFAFIKATNNVCFKISPDIVHSDGDVIPFWLVKGQGGSEAEY